MAKRSQKLNRSVAKRSTKKPLPKKNKNTGRHKKKKRPVWLPEGKFEITESRNESIIMETANLQYIEAKGRACEIVLWINEADKKIPSSKSLGEMAAELCDKNIKRVHNSFLINLNHITRHVKIKNDDNVILKSGCRIPISRNKEW